MQQELFSGLLLLFQFEAIHLSIILFILTCLFILLFQFSISFKIQSFSIFQQTFLQLQKQKQLDQHNNHNHNHNHNHSTNQTQQSSIKRFSASTTNKKVFSRINKQSTNKQTKSF
eukprot:TRINITY_DN774_c0_g1_i2.p1 TRINITY_DN774_c0_g1~~TRINITY_DN774_c0_g1_i2.p1  ORF type:complete len:115 (-),score=21.79 TRINITY_DN774_c0_g1_i2:168-512(-)